MQAAIQQERENLAWQRGGAFFAAHRAEIEQAAKDQAKPVDAPKSPDAKSPAVPDKAGQGVPGVPDGGASFPWLPAGIGVTGTSSLAVAYWLLRRKKTTTTKPDGTTTTSTETIKMGFTATTRKVWLPRHKTWVHFTHRDTMRKRYTHNKAHLPFGVPATTLPVDSTGGMKVSCPMDGNDSLGDCMEAMACHVDNMLTYGQGKPNWTESTFDLTALENQYQQASGGDNGLDEPTLLTQCWKPGLAGVAAATYVDSMDVDVTNVPLAQYLIDQFYAVCLMWSVPDDFINGFAQGTVWPTADTPNPNNGHGTPLASVHGPGETIGGQSIAGFYELWTWGTYAFVSAAFVASVDPATFVVFSTRQFDPKTGLDSKGRHITVQAAAWVACGGSAIPQSVINSFPPPVNNPPPPPPPPPPPGGFTPPITLNLSGVTATDANGQNVQIVTAGPPNTFIGPFKRTETLTDATGKVVPITDAKP